MNKKFKFALKRSKNHNFEKEYRLCALIIKGGKIVSIGFNNNKYHSIIDKYNNKDYPITLHAEMNAILKARAKGINIKGSKMLVLRLLSDGSVAIAKPCEVCQRIIKDYGIKRVKYTINNNNIGLLKVSELY